MIFAISVKKPQEFTFAACQMMRLISGEKLKSPASIVSGPTFSMNE